MKILKNVELWKLIIWHAVISIIKRFLSCSLLEALYFKQSERNSLRDPKFSIKKRRCIVLFPVFL